MSFASFSTVIFKTLFNGFLKTFLWSSTEVSEMNNRYNREVSQLRRQWTNKKITAQPHPFHQPRFALKFKLELNFVVLVKAHTKRRKDTEIFSYLKHWILIKFLCEETQNTFMRKMSFKMWATRNSSKKKFENLLPHVFSSFMRHILCFRLRKGRVYAAWVLKWNIFPSSTDFRVARKYKSKGSVKNFMLKIPVTGQRKTCKGRKKVVKSDENFFAQSSVKAQLLARL